MERGLWALVWHLNTPFVPSLGILITNFAPNCGFDNPTKVYFIKFKLFSSPKGWKVHQKNADIDTCITPCKLTKLWYMGFCVLKMLNPSFHNSARINLLIHPMTCF